MYDGTISHDYTVIDSILDGLGVHSPRYKLSTWTNCSGKRVEGSSLSSNVYLSGQNMSHRLDERVENELRSIAGNNVIL